MSFLFQPAGKLMEDLQAVVANAKEVKSTSLIF
jgi:hypothetical protein